ncbi:DNA topoisomerase [Aminobacter sp. MSH1]|uniref:type IA DNA topoisomerase n=1 Tax=Aminobacter sp. MSH1 TaxID=374606 RepID=UPI000D38B3A2|nr:DNA topoisomerase [Aminobacter sp. MSH1]
MKIMVVESPNKVKSLSAILGDDWKVMASSGHIRDLPKKELGISLPGFELHYELMPGLDGKPHTSGKARVDRIRLHLSDAEMVYLATDPDREGEAIAWHLKDALGLRESDYQRVTFGSIEPAAVSDALRKVRKIDMDSVYAQEGRRALDRLVGYLVSPVLSDMAGMNLSAGRVQSVALRLIVDRERAIRAFRVTNHFGAVVVFDGGAWSAKWDTSPFVSEDEPYVMDEPLAARAAGCKAFRVETADVKHSKENPPSPFDTALLLQAASVKLKMGAAETMKAAQALFEGPPGAEHGVITYHRTDSVNFSEESLAEIRAYAQAAGLPVADKPRKWKESEDAQAGHQAIRPTDLAVEEAGETEAQRSLYRLIRERAIASQLAEAQYCNTVVRLVGVSEGTEFTFVAKGRVMTAAGWRTLTRIDAADEGDGKDDETGAVPALPVGSGKQADSGEISKLKTAAPARYTEASLVKKLKADGIGRPATYSAIINTIQQRNYVALEKRAYVPTPIGEMLVDGLVKAGFGFVELGFTRDMEARLDLIAKGQAQYRDVVSAAHAQLQQELIGVTLNTDLKPAHSCPNCNAPLRRLQRPGKATIWFCTGEATCKTFMDDENGKPVARKSYPCPKCSTPLRRFKRKKGPGYGWVCPSTSGCETFLDDHNGKPLALHACPKCSRPLRRYPKKNADGKLTGLHGWFCTGGDECKTHMEDVNGKPVEIRTAPCPKCDRLMHRRMGQYGWYWGCSGYRDGCKTMMADEGGKPVPKRSGSGSGKPRTGQGRGGGGAKSGSTRSKPK